MLLSSKINKIRTFALLLIFIGVGIMYIGFLFPSIMALFLVIGMLAVLASVGIYFWIGMLSTQAPLVVCPACNKKTKVLGKRDQCMHCKAILSLDPQDQSSEESKKMDTVHHD
ncbi:Zinc-ribbon containing domain-containing protein [Seinonella peptonophila]|uniref:Zinc-ribbon containing domain-containing protein n=1 Tax=Seinonella peptonophila TaxID=112248 RepID=A0A1M4ZKF1_9BACL|nr:YgzB family protein [Seinonella peptonophila]SHF18292.1 Zinc-ribbon containing domain-containing protein [Seinonella peptonophila]